MIKAIDYQKVDLNDDEWAYYQELSKQFGKDEFKGLFKTDDQGVITSITPTKPVSWLVLFFVQQLMINQHLREKDAKILELEGRIRILERGKNE